MISKEAPPFIAKAPGIWAIQNEIASAAELVASGDMTPEDAAKYITDIANETIAENAD
jgi:polyhydroxyalkanoate synthesis regulator phasin